MDAEKIRVQGKWKAYLDEWIELKEKMIALNDAMSAEFGDKYLICEDSTTYSKLDEMNRVFPESAVRKFLLYSHGEDIADALDLEIYEYKDADLQDFNSFRFFLYRGYEFFWLR